MNRARNHVLRLAFEDEDEDEFIVLAIRRPRWLRERAEDFDILDDRDFCMRYRLSKSTVLSILEKIEAHLEYETDRSVKIIRCLYIRIMINRLF